MFYNDCFATDSLGPIALKDSTREMKHFTCLGFRIQGLRVMGFGIIGLGFKV